ncbi:hypothetical protein BIW11_06154 [Tropilaelaps mercedesae]|uniref:RING-type domain-containing protein n=1 Tax=Tropilaelaps mercedesae TaxID=418985 RepID=A0A1V9XZF7_9ACAR|nr:hypothetical protein BIW11_06154 [Tropilaelaps mercedesae]
MMQEYLFDSVDDDTFVCFGDDLLVDASAAVERCVICYRIPLSPRYVASPCRTHIVCVECGDRLKTCPLCRRRVQALYRNLDMRKLNNSVELRCPFNELGCKVVCEVKRWKSHIRECPYEADAWKAYFRQRWANGEPRTVSSCLAFLAKGYRRIKLRTRLALGGQHESLHTQPDPNENATYT